MLQSESHVICEPNLKGHKLIYLTNLPLKTDVSSNLFLRNSDFGDRNQQQLPKVPSCHSCPTEIKRDPWTLMDLWYTLIKAIYFFRFFLMLQHVTKRITQTLNVITTVNKDTCCWILSIFLSFFLITNLFYATLKRRKWMVSKHIYL
jgi:hypothetical protein